ncbi:MAG: MFS transporter, partial [Candidatus Hydrogenedentes bacterium]|nr:MFS transporter [Candidatus Hydrogenedentota bacterium]
MEKEAIDNQAGLPSGVRVRLNIMMFLQFAIHAVWIVPVAAYLGRTLSFTTGQIAMVANSAALGCLLAPVFIGMVTDRFFAGEKVLGILNLVGAALLLWASRTTEPRALFVILLLQQLCYMPTWAITSAIALANCRDTAKDFPKIRVFGSIGWVATGLFGITAAWLGKPFDTTHFPMVAAAVLSAAAGLFAFALPHTPPPAAGTKTTLADVLSLKALALMKRPSFALFIIVSLLVMVPFSLYWTYCSLFLVDRGFQAITFSMNFGQFGEIFFMLMIPLVLARLGIKWGMSLGLAALLVRYLFLSFGSQYDQPWMYFGGIVVHGLIYGFFFVGGQIYIDRKAPKEVRAAAQGFIFLITFGAGLFLGNYLSAQLIEYNSSISEPVVQTYEMPSDFASDMLSVEGASVADVKIYSRAVTADEVAVMNARYVKDDLRAGRLEQAAAEPVRLEEGLIYAGELVGLAGTKPGSALTFAASITLPEGEDDLSGTLFAMGKDKDALQIGLDNTLLFFRAGENKIAQRVAVPRAKSVHVV